VLGLKDKRHEHVKIRVRVRTDLPAGRALAARARFLAPAKNRHCQINRRRKLPHPTFAAKQIGMAKRPILKRAADNAFYTFLAN
jgi:hypothetical protein